MGQLPKKFCHPGSWVSPSWLTVSLFPRNVSVMGGHGCVIIIQLHLNKCTWLCKECYGPTYPAVPHSHVVRLRDCKVLWVPWRGKKKKKKALHECNRFPFVHIASGPTSVVLWSTGSDLECCTCVGLFTNVNGDAAPSPRSQRCKALTWQPTKHTFCKALSGLCSTRQLRVRIETWSRQGEKGWARGRWAKSMLWGERVGSWN